jgi:hypothetical protein
MVYAFSYLVIILVLSVCPAPVSFSVYLYLPIIYLSIIRLSTTSFYHITYLPFIPHMLIAAHTF